MQPKLYRVIPTGSDLCTQDFASPVLHRRTGDDLLNPFAKAEDAAANCQEAIALLRFTVL